jgi:cytosine/adenosine deaminase-related metal-dependent hydrolase
MVNELMQAWLLHRAVGGPGATGVAEVLEWATGGGADVLGLHTGRLVPGACADLVLFDIDEPRFHGVWQAHQAPLICGEPVHARRVMVDGRWVVEEGRVLGIDYDALRADATGARKRIQAALA